MAIAIERHGAAQRRLIRGPTGRHLESEANLQQEQTGAAPEPFTGIEVFSKDHFGRINPGDLVEVEGFVANQGGYLYINDGLTVDGLLLVSGTGSRAADVNFNGAQTVGGVGEIRLSRENAIGEEAVFNRLDLVSQSFNEREDLIFGADLTLSLR